MGTVAQYCADGLAEAKEQWDTLTIAERAEIVTFVRNLDENEPEMAVLAKFANMGVMAMLAVDPVFGSMSLDEEERGVQRWANRRF